MKLYIIIFILFLIIIISYTSYEKFTEVDEQKDVDINGDCLIPRNIFYIDMNHFFKKLEQTFRDSKDYDSDIKVLRGRFGNVISSYLLSDKNFENFFRLNEYQTNQRMFKLLMFKFTNYINDSNKFHLLHRAHPSITDNNLKIKDIILYGDQDKYVGLVRLFVEYITFFKSNDLSKFIDQLYNKGIITDSRLREKYEKYYKLNRHRFKDIDSNMRSLYRQIVNPSIGNDDRIDVNELNKKIKSELNIDIDIQKAQGYHSLRMFINELKKIKDGSSGKKKDVADNLYDFYTNGSNSRISILRDLMDKYYDTNDIFDVWNASEGKYGETEYGAMNRILKYIEEIYINENKREPINDKDRDLIFKLLMDYQSIYGTKVELTIEDIILSPPICED